MTECDCANIHGCDRQIKARAKASSCQLVTAGLENSADIASESLKFSRLPQQCLSSAFQGSRWVISETFLPSRNLLFQQMVMRYSWKRKHVKRLEFFHWWALWLPVLFYSSHQNAATGAVYEGFSPSLPSQFNSTIVLATNNQLSAVSRKSHLSTLISRKIQVTSSPFPTKTPSLAGPIQPTLQPQTRLPTKFPTRLPTRRPTFAPSKGPSRQPSDMPSFVPSILPSQFPSTLPTFTENLTAVGYFTQQFNVPETSVFKDVEVDEFQQLFENYTAIFGNFSGRVNTTCHITKQILQRPITHTRLREWNDVSSPSGRFLQGTSNTSDSAINTVQYEMIFESLVVNVTDYPDLFRKYVTANLESVVRDLEDLGLNITSSLPPLEVVVTPSPTFAPSVTGKPSLSPTLRPSVSPRPSNSPSKSPTNMPTINTQPTDMPSILTINPSALPSMAPSRPVRRDKNSSSDTVTVILVAIAGAIGLILIALFIYCWRKKRLRESAFHAVPADGSGRKRTHSRIEIQRVTSWRPSLHGRNHPNGRDSLARPATTTTDSRTTVPYTGNASGQSNPGLVSPSDSMASHQSLLSVGNSMGGDSVDDEPDTTQNLADEFDKYKDQNLERMRADVEGNLTGFDGMMSQALTKALMEDDELNSDPKELLWGGHGKQSGIEIEASALCEVNDWLKRTEYPSLDESRAFMQDVLNKMVASVRHGVLGPKEASRAVHECAALLGLQLANEIPGSTLIVSGLRKTSTAEDVIDAFRTFGEIDEAAVASNQRGFAVVRYVHSKSIDRALHEYRTGEIVVQDVAIQVKVLKSELGALPGPSDISTPAVPAATPGDPLQ